MSEEMNIEQRRAAVEAEEQQARRNMLDIGEKLVILSGKGGVGKSTVAANLAVALASSGFDVGLLDVDVHGPSIPKLLGLDDKMPISAGGKIMPINFSDHLAVMSIGFLVHNKAEAVIWRGPMKYGVIRQFLSNVAWGKRDYLVIDCPPGTGDEPLSVAQLIGRPASAIMVTTPHELAVQDVRRCISFCNKVNLPLLGVIENMSGFICPHCGKKSDVFGAGGGVDLAREMEVPFLGEIPLDLGIATSGESGDPFARMKDKTPSAAAFLNIVRTLSGTKPHSGGNAAATGQEEEAVQS